MGKHGNSFSGVPQGPVLYYMFPRIFLYFVFRHIEVSFSERLKEN